MQLFWNPQERRLRALWRLVLQFLLFVVALLLFGTLGGLLWFGWQAQQGQPLTPAALMASPGFMAVNAVVTLLATLVSVAIAARVFDRRPLADFGLRLNRAWWLDCGFGLLLGALLMTLIFLVQLTLGWISIDALFYDADPQLSFGVAIIAPLILFLCVGIYEEVLSRGYLLTNLAQGLNLPRIGPRGAIVIAWLFSSAVFGLLHATNPNATALSTFMLVLAGLFLGLGYVLTGRLGIPIGLHITWNFFQGNVYGFPVSGGAFDYASFIAITQGGPPLWTGDAFGPEAGLLGLGAILLGSALTLGWVRLRDDSLALYQPMTQPPPRASAARPEPLHESLQEV